jgi:hypothetical protein
MLEKENIQERGFRNITEGGKATGFQVQLRSTYYRGVWLTQLTEATVTIDGQKFEKDLITWTIGGKTYTQADLAKYPDTYWPIYEAAILSVKKPGGLNLGIHDVEVAYGYTSSYTPYPYADSDMPRITTYKRRMTLVG